MGFAYARFKVGDRATIVSAMPYLRKLAGLRVKIVSVGEKLRAFDEDISRYDYEYVVTPDLTHAGTRNACNANNILQRMCRSIRVPGHALVKNLEDELLELAAALMNVPSENA